MASIERTPGQNPIDQIAANDVNLTETENEINRLTDGKPDKLSEKEKKEYENLNRDFKKLINSVSEFELSEDVINSLTKNKQSYIMSGETELYIYSASRGYSVAVFRPYKTGNMITTLSFNQKEIDRRPVIDEGNGKVTPLSVDGYNKMLIKMNMILEEERRMKNDMKKNGKAMQKAKEEELINSL